MKHRVTTIVFTIIALSMFLLIGCSNEPPNNKKHVNVKITVLDAYKNGISGSESEVRLIAMTNIKNYPVVIYVNPWSRRIDEITLCRMAKTFKNFTFKTKILYEDLDVENSMSFYMEAYDIILFPNNNVEINALSLYDDMSPIGMPVTDPIAALLPKTTGTANAGATATATSSNNINITLNGKNDKINDEN